MSVALCLVAQEPIAGLDLSICGKALGRVPDQAIDALCDALEVTSLVAFASQNPGELAEIMGEEVIDDDDELPAEEWFAPEDGLVTVRALIMHLTAVPSALPESAAVLNDLNGFERVLAALAEKQVQWHLALDM